MRTIEQRPSEPATGKTSHHWSDWAGFWLNLALVGFTLVRSWRLGIFLLPGVAFELMVAAAFLIRRPAKRRLLGLGPRITTYGGALIMLVFIPVAATWFPAWVAPSSTPALRIGGALVWLFGTTLGLWPLWYLRKSFSLEPQARDLVTTGPYRFARHPIYSMYILNYIGLWLSHLSVPLSLALCVWTALTLGRMYYEEQVLTLQFPAYREYRKRVGALGPRLWAPTTQVTASSSGEAT
ncbi:MAG: isoprenylcysteine carboxylmethyltransferase family protein [Gemmatimonadales bacterium]|nr:MAG: isoprenylcysteine carboxylmethyltransferase family protein [Gemmatimonadales bacterium]